MKVWMQRIFRFWLIVCLPLAAYFAYEAKESHDYSVSFFEHAKRWQERADEQRNGGFRGLFDPKEEREKMLGYAMESRDRSEKYTMYAIAAAVSPLGLLFALFAGRWIWSGSQPGDTGTPASGLLARSRPLLMKSGAVLLSIGATALVYLYAPEKAVATVVSVVVQLIFWWGALTIYRKFKGQP